MRLQTVVLTGIVAVLATVASAAAATLRPGFVESPIATGLSRPTAMAFAPDGRLFVTEQDGRVRVIAGGVLLPEPFATVTVSSAGERGLLGIAFDPDFPLNGFVYVYYTAVTPVVHNRVSRFTADGNRAAPGSERVILDLEPLTNATNHNGGAIHFGPDGTLYVAVGENANGANAQTLGNRLGKVLRVNRDGSIPADNPFFDQATGENRAIWALGLRNPYTFAIEPLSGRMMINDVGQSSWEEINDGRAGANYGWPHTEGPTSDPRFQAPVFAYGRTGGTCAISGGTFYPALAGQFPSDYAGDYLFADFCAGWIRQYDVGSGALPADFASGISFPVDLLVGPEGGLYYLARGSGGATGMVARIDFAGGLPDDRPPAPQIHTPSAETRYVAGEMVRFSGEAADAEDGSLEGSRLTWTVTFHHGDVAEHVHGPVAGVSGSFRIPSTGDPSADVWYRIRLTAIDSAGQVSTTIRDLHPRTVVVALTTSPGGLMLTINGHTASTPQAFATVLGMRLTVVAPSPQKRNGATYHFVSWSDRGGSSRTLVATTRPARLDGVFRRRRLPPGQPLSPCSQSLGTDCRPPDSAPADPAPRRARPRG